jgi:hypothetical protein
MAGTYSTVLDVEMSNLVNAAGLQVPDVIRNPIRWLIVTERLKSLLEKKAEARIEFLPFRLTIRSESSPSESM